MNDINIDNIKVSLRLDEVINNAVNEGYKNVNNKNSILKKLAITVVIVGSIGITLSGTSFGERVLANIGLEAFDIGNYIGVNKNLKDYTTVVDSSVTKNGITVQLNEVILDRDELIVSTTTKIDTAIESNESLLVFGDVYINGKKISEGAEGSKEQIDQYTMESILKYNLKDDLPNGELDIKIKYREALLSRENSNSEEIKGPWEFEFKASGDTLVAKTTNIKLNNSFKLDNGQKVILNEYRSNDVGTKIYYDMKDKDEAYDIILRGYDDLGNEVSFYSSYEGKNDGVMKNESEISAYASKLVLTPYAVAYSEKSGKINDNYHQVGEEFTIEIK
ncbi:hypothetical protein CM240_2764 [Clostridium bornimense]|uniref:DUF4179 domain-containing protein n=1 Tax=Clostridium bornimense TaxID=1216932 RepID=W6RZ32_9CLOT|nr:DUF4179 domain-containing protein [Clostridium bornimense]CDM69881.1 hypothetical protein CM240_2764 [Clostridium bornimense]